VWSLVVVCLGLLQPVARGQGPSPQNVAEHCIVRSSGESSTLDRQTGQIISTVDVELLNLGGKTLLTPLHLAVNLTTSSVQVAGALGGPGSGPYNAYYLDLSSHFPSGRMESGERTTRQITFTRDRGVHFQYELVPYSTVQSENPPEITISPLTFSVNEGQSLSFGVTAFDPDGDSVIILAAPGISNATFSATGGVAAAGTFSFSPDFDQEGQYTLKVTARDPLGLEDSEQIQITVSNVNRAPILGGLTNRTVKEGGLLLVNVPVDEPDDDLLSIGAAPLPANAVFSSDTRTFLFAPDFTQAGSYDIDFVADDGSLSSQTQTLQIVVEEVPVASPGDTNQLTLVVDPIQSPTLLAIQRVTGAVNAGTNPPPRPAATAALITGLSPANARQGQSTNVILSGQAGGLFPTHFSDASKAFFGAGVQVNALSVLSETQAIASITVNSDAESGIRNVSVVTSNETAISLVAFNVNPGLVTLTGTLIDSVTSNAIANAIITVEGTGFTTMSAPDGTFSLVGIPAGEATLIINPPDHQLLRLGINTAVGQSFDLGMITTAATVFDPNAPASVSLLSILGRGLGAFETSDLEKTRNAIRDALILCGGSEAGVLDEFGNQLNPDLVGPGLLSATPEGVDILAERVDRGESEGLAEILHPITFALQWTNGPPLSLADWMDGLQTVVDQAWANPNDPENYLAIMMFNHGPTLSPTPPQLTPETRLNMPQTYMFFWSLMSYAADPEGTNVFASLSLPQDMLLADVQTTLWSELLSVVSGPAAYADPPPPVGTRRFTAYWRNFGTAKNNLVSNALLAGFTGYVTLMALVGADIALGTRGGLAGAVVSLGLHFTVIGQAADLMHSAFAGLAAAARVPIEPKLLSYEILNAHQVSVKVKVRPEDTNDGKYFYTLYRFRGPDEGRQLAGVAVSTSTNDTELTIIDYRPLQGSYFYAATLTHIYNYDGEIPPDVLNVLTPWWNMPSALTRPFQVLTASKQLLVSEYSDPLMVFVGTPASRIPISDIEINPSDNSVYYAFKSTNITEQNFLRFENLGAGTTSTFANAGFAAPGFEGLAMDAEGNLYSHNKASDALYGGRLFIYRQPNGARDFVGSYSYYSRELAFANVVDGYTMDFGPAAAPGFSDQDLYVAELLSGQVRRAPVKAFGSDPYHHVAQPYAPLPLSGKPIDMEHDASGNTYILMADALGRQVFRDLEKGPMHIPKGVPIKNPCPPGAGNVYVDPLYLHSGEYYEDVTDIRIPGRGPDFIWARKYRSQNGTNTVQGNNWDFSYNLYIEQNTNTGGIVVHDGNTRADEYAKSGTNNLWTLREFFRELSRNPDQTYSLDFEDKGAWKFHALDGSPAQGRIKESVDRHGNSLEFFYDGLGRLERINDTLDRDILIAYGGNGRISDITDFAGRTWHYEYYGAAEPGGNPGDLKSCRTPLITGTPNGNDFPSGRTVTYTYSKGFAEPERNGNLLTITDAKGQTWLRNTYATNTSPDDLEFDRVIRQVWGDSGDIIDIVYVEANPTAANGGAVLKAILNDRNGHVKEYFYNPLSQCTVERVYTGTAHANQPSTESANRPAGKLRASDPDYFETKYEWNVDSLKKREIHPNGNVTEWVYESDLDPGAPARTRGNIREIHHLPGTHLPVGDQTSIVERFEYDTSHGRGCCGYNFVTRHTDGRGNETLKFYDAAGNPTSVVHRIPSITEDYEYNSFGQLTKAVHPDNGSGHRRTDVSTYHASGPQRGYLHQLVVDSGNLNLTTSYGYDPVGNVTSITDPKGHDLQYVYNALNEPVRATSREVRDGSGVRYITDTFYDANGNVIRVDEPNLDDQGVVLAGNPVITRTKEYDILNTLRRITEEVDDARQIVTEYEYDGNRNRTRERYGEAVNGSQPLNVTRFVYDERDLLFDIIKAEGDPAKSSTRHDYDANGNLVRIQTGIEDTPRIRLYEYDAYDRKVRETDPMGNEILYTYNGNHSPVSIQYRGETNDVPGDAGNLLLSEWQFDYDPMDRATNSVQSWFLAGAGLLGDGQAATRTVYNDLSRELRIIDDNGRERLTLYDTANRVAAMVDGANNVVSNVYDLNGNVIRTEWTERSDAGSPAQVFISSNVYDNLDRQTLSYDPIGNVSELAYDSRNNRIRFVDARGNARRTDYDGLNRPIRATMDLTGSGVGGGAIVGVITNRSTYDDSSRLIAQTDGLGNATLYSFDPLGRRTAITLADGTSHTVVFDVHGNVITNTDPNGTTVATTYDALNRATQKSITPGSGVSADSTFESFQYDGLSRLIRVQNDDAVVTRDYDSLSRLIRESLNGQVTRYEYDGVGNLLTLEYPGGRVVTNTFDVLNRCKTVGDVSGLLATFDYAGPDRIERVDLGNNTRVTRSFDGARRVVGTLHVRDPGGAATALDSRAYEWDAAYNKTRRTDVLAGITNRYTYDSINRLVASTNSDAGPIQYTLDAAGNRVSVAGGPRPGAYLRQSSDGQLNQYTATSFDTRRYDHNGNLTGINTGQPNARLLEYDYRDRLTRLTEPGTGLEVSFAYDALGRRIAKFASGPTNSAALYFFDGMNQVLEERTTNQTVTSTYVYGPGIDSPVTVNRNAVPYFFHTDDQRSVVKMTDAAGNIAEQYAYSDFGEVTVRNGGGAPLPVSAIGNPYLFTGREFDPETGLYFYRSRYLDPLAGRFISRDGIGLWGDPANLGNAYAYVANSPWTKVDPDGHIGALMARALGFVLSPTGLKAGAGAFSAAGAWWAYGEITRSQRCWEPFRWGHFVGKATTTATLPITLFLLKGKVPPGALQAAVEAAESPAARMGGGQAAREFDQAMFDQVLAGMDKYRRVGPEAFREGDWLLARQTASHSYVEKGIIPKDGVNFWSWQNWSVPGELMEKYSAGGQAEYIRDVVRSHAYEGGNIHFVLDDLPILDATTYGHQAQKMYTAQELNAVISDPVMLRQTTFYIEGRVVSHETVYQTVSQTGREVIQMSHGAQGLGPQSLGMSSW